MIGADLLQQVQAHGGAIWPDGDRLELEVPDGFPDVLIVALKQRKAEVLAHLRRRAELIDLPFPLGYGGLPAEDVLKAEAHNDRLGVTDPVARRLNVLSWMRCHYRDLGDMEMAEQMREAYHELRHADPRVQALCGLCEYEAGAEAAGNHPDGKADDAR